MQTIPPDVDAHIQAIMAARGYPTPGDVMRAALNALDDISEKTRQQIDWDKQPDSNGTKPVWQQMAEAAQRLPEDEVARLPGDGADQHDHYIYGTPKRPS